MSLLPAFDEPLRPQYHFTAEKGWLNDPNGLVYFNGEYHLFFQYNPFGTEWGNMTWGHAVSKDLLHWSQLPNAVEPDALGTIFSGSAVVDRANTSGFGAKGKPPVVLIYTAAGGTNDASKGQSFSQCLAYTTDGRMFTKFAGNPAIPHIEGENRDPKVFWHAETRSWVLALYLDGDRYAIFRSPDLKKWIRSGDVTMPGSSECPDFFELGVGGKKYWVFWSANGRYRLGTFDGYKFTPTTEPLESNFGANCYADQTYDSAPGGRRIQFGWMRDGHYPGMPFNQQMTIPRELTLRSTPEGPRLSVMPVRELTSLRSRSIFSGPVDVVEPRRILTGTDLLEVRATIRRDRSASLKFGEASVSYDAGTHTVHCQGGSARVAPAGKTLDLIVYLDRTTVEVFADHGLVSMPFCFVPKAPPSELVVASGADGAAFEKLEVWELKSARM